MNSYSFISINKVISDLYYDSLMTDCPKDFIIDKCVELMGICNIPKSLQNKEAILQVENYRALIPCDLLEVRRVAISKDGVIDPKYSILCAGKNNFSPEALSSHSVTYQIHGGIITLSIPKCEITIAYNAIATDQDGYPMIINNSAFLRAATSYVRFQWFSILFGQNKVNEHALTHAEQTYNWNIANAMSNLNTPTEDEAETLLRFANSAVKQPMHENGFADMDIMNTLKH